LLDQAVAGAGSKLLSIGVTPPLEMTGPANAPILGIPLVTPSADGAMLHQDKATLDAATPNATPGTLVARDSLGGSAFQVVSVQAWLAVPLLQVANAPAPPANNPPSGVYLYADGGAWKARSTGGVITTMVPVGIAGPTLQTLDWIAGSCTTSSAQAQLLLTYTLPANALVELDALIQARNPANGNSSWFRRVVRVKRSTSAAVLKSTATPVPDDDENGCAISVVVKLFSVDLEITGPQGLVCFGSARVQVFAP
jgi:hypothetical protein